MAVPALPFSVKVPAVDPPTFNLSVVEDVEAAVNW
jgi:hypothetical protein